MPQQPLRHAFNAIQQRVGLPPGYVPQQSEVNRQYSLAQSLAQQQASAPPVTNVLQGLNHVAQSVVGGLAERRASEGEQRRAEQTAEQMAGVIDWAAFGVDPNVGRQLLTLNPELGNALFGMQLEQNASVAGAPEPIEINGQLVDPVTYEVLGDYRDPTVPDAPETIESVLEDGQVHTMGWNPETGRFDIDMGVAPEANPLVENNINPEGGQIPAAFEAVDRAFAQDVYVPWTSGGFADSQKQLDQLREVLGQLEGGENITGPLIGVTPDFFLTLFNPEAINARERVEEVVQRNLREILGAQFTENEGRRLIERAFNPSLDDAVNAARLAALVGQIEAAYQAKEAAVEYFRTNGTLWGYENQHTPTIADFDAAIDAAGGAVESQPDDEALPPGDYRWNEETLELEPIR